MTTEPSASSGPLPGTLIAVVEDDQSLRRAVGRLLRATGFTVRAFGSAEEYLEAGGEPRPDCLVLDIHLGGLNGFGLHERLRERGTTVPTIFMTGHDDPTTRERARKVGAAAYLRKPFEDEALLSAIEEAVASR